MNEGSDRIVRHCTSKVTLAIWGVVAVCMSFQFGCKSGPTEPEFKNPREYTWDATVLSAEGNAQTQLFSIWGSNPQDVYASGFCMAGGQKGALFHYDGKGWAAVKLPSADYNWLMRVTGFASNDVWVAGARLFSNPLLDSAAILHFNGAVWNQLLPSSMGARRLQSAWGSSRENVLMGSVDGKVIQFDRGSWRVETMYPGLSINDFEGDATRTFAIGNTWKGTRNDSDVFLMRTQSTWEIVSAQIISQQLSQPLFGSNALYSPAPGIHYSCGYVGVFQLVGDRWVKVFSPIASLNGMGGSSSTNMLVVGWRDSGPTVYQWDGTVWDEIKLPVGLVPSDVSLCDVWMTGKEAFIVGNNGSTTYVLHGR